MPKASRGGKRTGGSALGGSFGATPQQMNMGAQQTAQPQQPQQQPTLNQPSQNKLPPNYQPPEVKDGVYIDLDDNYNDYLYLQHQKEYKSGLNDAMKQYISQADAGGGYSMAQWLNYKLNSGMKLDANEREIYKQITKKGYDLGQNAVLFRADHDQVLKDLGIADYTKMTEKQLQKALIGQTYTNKAVLSTSYDKNKNPFYHLANNSNSGVSGGREIYYNFNTKSTVKVVQGDRKQAEIAIVPTGNTQFKITNVRYDNSVATPRNSSSRRRLIVDVEVG